MTSHADTAGPDGRPLARYELLIFMTGAVTLSMEILASRIMTPYFGVSLYIWSGILTITLLFLALGSRCTSRRHGQPSGKRSNRSRLDSKRTPLGDLGRPSQSRDLGVQTLVRRSGYERPKFEESGRQPLESSIYKRRTRCPSTQYPKTFVVSAAEGVALA